MGVTTALPVEDAAQVAALRRELAELRLRLEVTRLVATDISDWLNDDDAWMDSIIDDVIRLWKGRGPDDPQTLGGYDGLWSRYSGAVEYAPKDSDDEYRPEFCPTDGHWISDTEYYYAVWADHIEQLLAQGGPPSDQDEKSPNEPTASS